MKKGSALTVPAYHLMCEKCLKRVRKLLPKFEGSTCECGGPYKRLEANKMSAQIKETLDNGIMVRKVERLHNVEELVKERSKEPDKDDFI
jgi:hypothetical protein